MFPSDVKVRRGIVHRWFGGLVHRDIVHRSEPLAVSRKPMAISDALVHELYRLTEEEIRIVNGERT